MSSGNNIWPCEPSGDVDASSTDDGSTVAIITVSAVRRSRGPSVGAVSLRHRSNSVRQACVTVGLDVLIVNLAETVPRHDSHAEETADDAEGQGDDTLGREPFGQRRWRGVSAGQVKEVDRVTRGVAGRGHGLRGAGCEVLGGGGEAGGLEFEGRFDDGGDETGG